MLSFENDYSSTAAPQIVARMQAMANEQNSGYGKDQYCDAAANKIRKACDAAQADVWVPRGEAHRRTRPCSAPLPRNTQASYARRARTSTRTRPAPSRRLDTKCSHSPSTTARSPANSSTNTVRASKTTSTMSIWSTPAACISRSPPNMAPCTRVRSSPRSHRSRMTTICLSMWTARGWAWRSRRT